MDNTPSNTILKVLVLTMIFLSSLFLRVEYVKKTVIISPIRADSLRYVKYGFNIAENGIFSRDYPSKKPVPDSFRSPGYPLLIAFSIFIADKQFYPFLLYIQCFLGAITALLTYFIATRFLKPQWSICGAILVGLSPHMVSMGSYLLTETLFSFLLHAGVLLFLYALGNKNIVFLMSSAFFFGCAYLTNETALFLPFIFSVLALFAMQDKNFKSPFKIIEYRQLILFLIIFSLFPISWNIRNMINIPPEAPKSSGRAVNTLSHGAYPDFIYKDPKFQYFPYREDPEQPLFSSSINSFITILWKRVKKRPVRYFSWYLFEKPYYLWSWDILQGQGDIYVYEIIQSLYDISNFANFIKIAFKTIHIPMIVLAFAGIPFTLFKIRNNIYRQDAYIFILSIGIYYTFLYAVFAPWPRYSVPLRPELYLCALWTISELRLKNDT